MNVELEQLKSVLVSWVNTFPSLSKYVSSFDDLNDGIIICEILNQIDPCFSYPPVRADEPITIEQSTELYQTVQKYLQTDIVDEEAAASGEQVLNIDSIVKDHSAEELIYLLKIILGIAMKCSNNKVFVSRITSLDKSTQEVLMCVINDVLSTMVPQDGPINPDELEFKDFEDLVQEEDTDLEEDWSEWEDEQTPNSISQVIVDTNQETDAEFRRLQEELLQKKAEAEDLEASCAAVTSERNAALAEQERLQEEIKSLRKENLELQMKLDTALRSKSDGSVVQLTTEQSVRLRNELEKAEDESASLRERLSSLTKEYSDSKAELSAQLTRAQTQVEVLTEQVTQLQKMEQLVNTYKKQLQENRSGRDLELLQRRIRELEAAAQDSLDTEAKMKQLVGENRSLQNDVLGYQQRLQETEERLRNAETHEKELQQDIQVLREKNESLQLLVSPDPDGSPSVSHSSTVMTLDVLMNDSGSVSSGQSIPTSQQDPINVTSSKAYLEQANELLLANQRVIALNKKIEGLQSELLETKKQMVSLQESMTTSPSDSETVSLEQHRLLVVKLSVKEEELNQMQEQYKKADTERSMCLAKIAQLQADNQEMTEDLAAKVAKCIDLEERKTKLGVKMKALLTQMQQLEANRLSLVEEVKKEKERAANMFDVHRREEEVMFRCIHKLGKSTLMHYYVTDLDNYKPKGWLARVRASQAKTMWIVCCNKEMIHISASDNHKELCKAVQHWISTNALQEYEGS